ncbi:coiled-coil domain-containing protein [Pseudomonas syringae]|nr:hypothetical protein [Pseudomonas syringae]
MKTFEQLTTERNQYHAQIKNLHIEIAQWEHQLTHQGIDVQATSKLETDINNARSSIGSIEQKISEIDQGIAWFERKQNSTALISEYQETMQNWSLDKQDLLGKRQALSTRLEDTKAQLEKMLTEARQAEESAATAYAQAVAWGDTEAENKAAAEAQEAAKKLAATQEHQRRQQLIMAALINELKTVDEHIAETDQGFAKAERAAVSLATERLQDEWDAAAERLAEIGAKLYSGKAYLGHEHMAFNGLMIRSELDFHKTWTQTDLMQLSRKFPPQHLVDAQLDSVDEVDEAA